MYVWNGMATLALWSASAHASEATDLLEAFFTEVVVKNSDVTRFCATDFEQHGQTGVGCGEISKHLATAEVKRGRSVVGDQEAIAEVRVAIAGGVSWPAFFLARPTSEGWRFVQVADGDGTPLSASVRLDPADQTGALELPVGLYPVVTELNLELPDPKKLCVDPKADACAAVVRRLKLQEGDYLPVVQSVLDDACFVYGTVVGRKRGLPLMWTKFVKSGESWRLVGEEAPPGWRDPSEPPP